MRRSEKEIRDKHELEDIIRRARVCRIALSDGNEPYVVPMNFGYRDGVLYLHCAPEGKKIDILKQNDRVCFEMDIDGGPVPGETPCQWGMRYESVIGYGRAQFVEERAEKIKALGCIMEQYTQGPHAFSPEAVDKVTVLRIPVAQLSGKRSGGAT